MIKITKIDRRICNCCDNSWKLGEITNLQINHDTLQICTNCLLQLKQVLNTFIKDHEELGRIAENG